MENKYNEEEIKDITEREKKCLDFLKENEMTPAAQVLKVNVGNDMFADKVVPYLQDIKYKKDA
jgi:hypothetical protein